MHKGIAYNIQLAHSHIAYWNSIVGYTGILEYNSNKHCWFYRHCCIALIKHNSYTNIVGILLLQTLHIALAISR